MRTIPGTVVLRLHRAAPVASLLERWQRRHDPDDFTQLVAVVRGPVEWLVGRTLRRAGIRDPGACDEAVGLVFERLFSLGRDATCGHRVMFEGTRVHAGSRTADVRQADGTSGVQSDAAMRSQATAALEDRGESVDVGWAFVRCIARSRARDVARARRRRDGLIAGYAALVARDRGEAIDDRDDTDAARLRSAIESLDERSRQVVGLLLDGKSQTVIAHLLGVSEGTVSRVRARAIATLRNVLGADGAG